MFSMRSVRTIDLPIMSQLRNSKLNIILFFSLDYPDYRPDFEIRSAEFSVFCWDDGHHRGPENRPNVRYAHSWGSLKTMIDGWFKTF